MTVFIISNLQSQGREWIRKDDSSLTFAIFVPVLFIDSAILQTLIRRLCF